MIKLIIKSRKTSSDLCIKNNGKTKRNSIYLLILKWLFSNTRPACRITKGKKTISILLLAYKNPFIIKLTIGHNIEIVSYVFVGGMTTLVNYVVYFILLKIHSHWLIANSISWIFAVLFVYYKNKRYVLKSKNNIKKEFISFILLRFMTLLIENICLYLLIDLLNLQPMISKVCVSFITILSNYILCKFKIFKEEGVCHG